MNLSQDHMCRILVKDHGYMNPDRVVLDEASEAIVRAIEGVATDGGDKPHEDVVLTSVSVTATS